MPVEIQFPEEVMDIKKKSQWLNGVAERRDNTTKGIWTWFRPKLTELSYQKSIRLYKRRNELDREFLEKAKEYVKATPGTYDLDHIRLTWEEGGKPVFEYGTHVVGQDEIVSVDYRTEGIAAIADSKEGAKIEIRSNQQPLLHLPEGWSLLVESSFRSGMMGRHVSDVYVRWQPEISDGPQLIKIPDTLEMVMARSPENANVYTQKEVING